MFTGNLDRTPAVADATAAAGDDKNARKTIAPT